MRKGARHGRMALVGNVEVIVIVAILLVLAIATIVLDRGDN